MRAGAQERASTMRLREMRSGRTRRSRARGTAVWRPMIPLGARSNSTIFSS